MPSCLGGSIPSPRLRAVVHFRALLAADKAKPSHSLRRSLGEHALKQAGLDASYRSLLLWCRKLDIEGADSLADRSANSAFSARDTLNLDPKTAADAVLVCAWWSFRVGGIEIVDAPLLRIAASLIANRQSPIDNRLAEVIKAVDCYFSWPTDRRKFPFKAFKRWAKYDFEKWVFRARDDADFRAARTAAVTKTRRRQVNNHATRRAIDHLSEPRLLASGADDSKTYSDSPKTAPSSPLSPRERAGVRAAAPAADPVLLPALFSDLNRQSIIDSSRASAAPPDSLHGAVARLPDAYRVMLLRAAQGDRDARDQAVATLPLWWPSLDHASRANIDVRCDQFRREHPGSGRHVPGRKLAMLLAELSRSRHRPRAVGEVLSKAV